MLAAWPGEGMEAGKGEAPQTRPVTCSAAASSRGAVGTVCSVQQTSARAPWEQEPARNGAPAGVGVRKSVWFSASPWMPASIPHIAPCAHSSPPQAPHTSGTEALPHRCTQAPSIPSHRELSAGAGLHRLPSPGCARAPRTHLRATWMTPAWQGQPAGRELPPAPSWGAGGLRWAAHLPRWVRERREPWRGWMERSWRRDDGPLCRLVAAQISVPSCLAALLVLSKLTFPLGCPSQTFKSRESGPK